MSNAKPLVARTASDTGDSASLFELTQPSEAATVSTLREAVDTFVRRYLDEMEGETGTDFYALVLGEVEAPMLQAVMEYTRGNQTRAAQLLGLNRGTLRKKLRDNGVGRN
jgi:Fis family transcriptional regulator